MGLLKAVIAIASVAMPVLAGAAMELETGDIDVLRQEALDQVNQVREDNGFAPLEISPILNDAAQRHAEDMARNDFYAHVAPDGSAPRDRFLDEGGSQWQVVRENIARCTNCPIPPTLERVQSFQRGWLDSPEHRANILAEGLDSFGFGIVGAENRIFAVQNFSGAGTPRGLHAGEEPIPLQENEIVDRMVQAVNRARERQGISTVTVSSALVDVAGDLLPESDAAGTITDQSTQLFDLLPPGQRRDWTQLQVLSGACGGCGHEATAQDVNDFVDQWLNNPQYGSILLDGAVTDIGFAMLVDGDGRKVAIAVTGT